LVITVGFVLAAVAAGLFITTKAGFGSRPRPGAMESSFARELRLWSIPRAYKSMPNPVDCSDATLNQARAHWADHCATCHANNGSGDSMLGRTMYPPPPDMRQAATQSQSDGEIYYTINNGVRLTGMPAFGESGDRDMDSWKLVCFIRHLPHISEDEERQMQKLNPKTPDEIEEERQEEEFLNGGALHREKAN
jgi:mono/diheme cytochrome c family protein